MDTPQNLLRQETSPYLLQHAANPVHWRPWGQAALDEARQLGRPILLSIGYAACHWCHVMAHESFEDEATAALMNRLYVNIKVDREERPDIDHLYMAALHAMGEQGGWPLTMFLTPDGDPFWGGTYFPPEPRWGRPSFRQVLQGVADAWREEPDKVRTSTASIRLAVAAMASEHPGDQPGPDVLDATSAALLEATDPVSGGLSGAPKFPNPPLFRFLWQNAFRTGSSRGRQALHRLLAGMSQGGIYDHLGGGYARYSTDAEWLVPHFEKMLYDNAQILELLALAYADTPDPLYAERAEETVRWLVRDMAAQTVSGRTAFAASEDADSEGEEGRFYIWTAAEVDAVLGEDAAAFRRAYDVTAAGNWEGRTILRRVGPRGDAIGEAQLAASRAALLAARNRRPRPARDDKVLADWNALAVAALCRAGAVFARPDWVSLAGEVFDFVRTELAMGDGRVGHAWRLGRITAAGLLEDQAAMARAALALFESGGDAARLEQAEHFVAIAQRWFAAPGGSYYTTASDAGDVPLGDEARPRSAVDGVTPSGNAMMADVLARLWHLTGNPSHRARASAVLHSFGGLGHKWVSAPGLLAAADLLEEGAVVVVTGAPEATLARELVRTALASPDPAVCVLHAGDPGALAPGHPAHGKVTPGRASAFICRAGVCGLPVRHPADLAAALRRGDVTA
jgi:uncharacterized protein YyaL (SSP411 family)